MQCTQGNPKSSKKLRSADGTMIYAEAVGDPSKPPIVFIHGFGVSALVFDNIFADPKWYKNAYLVRYDWRGHGQSDMPTDEASWVSRRLAEDFDAVMRAFDIRKPFVAGWSMGATHIVDILTIHPRTYLSGIIYINALPWMGPVVRRIRKSFTSYSEENVSQTTDVNEYRGVAFDYIDSLTSVPGAFPRVLRQACLGDYMQQPRALPPRIFLRRQDESHLLKAGREGLPLLMVNAEKDRMIVAPELVKAMEGWKNMEVTEIPEAGHMPFLENPDVFRNVVLGWMNGAKFS